MNRCILSLLFFASVAFKLARSQASENDLIPGQYIVYYAEDADRASANERLFFSPTSAVASSSESFHVVRELKHAIVVAGIHDEHYQVLLKDPGVTKVIQVRKERRCKMSVHSLIFHHTSSVPILLMLIFAPYIL